MDLGWEKQIPDFTPEDWVKVVYEIETFSQLDQRKIFHLAYEKHLYRQVLDSIITLKQQKQTKPFCFKQYFALMKEKNHSAGI